VSIAATGVGENAKAVLRVVSGSPTAEELAVVTALVAAAGSGSAVAEEQPRRGHWADPMWTHRGLWLHGAGAWRSSGR
jgi:hypothetical protein